MSRLILSRSTDESVRIGPDFYVTVRDVRHGEVLLRCGDSLVRLPRWQTREVLPGVTITYWAMTGRRSVKLIFEAPQEVLILRTELLKQEAAK